MLPFRQRSYACIHPETYKYFFARGQVLPLWRRLSARYGEPDVNSSFGTLQLDTRSLLLRSVIGGNPITVIRKRGCTATDVDQLHQIFGFSPTDEHG